MTAGKSKSARKPAKKLTAEQLMATPKHMLAWLEGQSPRAIVTKDIICNRECLAANFLIAKGFPPTTFGNGLGSLMPTGGWLACAINDLPLDKPISAQRAIAAIKPTS